MFLATDVHYRGASALAAGLLFAGIDSDAAERAVTVSVDAVGGYEPGAFYRRELRPLLALWEKVGDVQPAAIFVDGYVWLGEGLPGLGAVLYEALGKRIPIIGVAKSRFAGNDVARPVLRGRSTRPLYVSAVGIEASRAVSWVHAMHGTHRMPTVLKRVDRLAREGR